jgi:hypothetical protein
MFAPEAAQVFVHGKDRDQHDQRNREVAEGAERLGAHSAAGPGDAHAQQRDADDSDDRAGHDRREETQQAAEDGCDQHGGQAGDDDRAVHHLHAQARVGHRHQRPDRGESHTHDDRQADAELPHADALDQRGNAAGKQVGVDQQRELLLGQLQCAADDQRHRDGAGVHHQHMLQADQEHLPRGQQGVDGVDFARIHRRLLKLVVRNR